MKIQPSYYFTIKDPDYSVKGSRDPLGFQVIWQQQAKKLIPYLSTVSFNLHDFQILCLAYYLYGEPDSSFVSFFLRFEQWMAYARFQFGDKEFNGTRRIKALLNDKEIFNLSTAREDQILTNQRAYGIWGKYNRPFTDLALNMQKDFVGVFERKIETLANKEAFTRFVMNLKEKEKVRVRKTDLELAFGVLQYSQEELDFYETHILLAYPPDHLQNVLHRFMQTNGPSAFSYGMLQSLQRFEPDNLLLKDVMTEIEVTERILSPLNRVFRYLQTKPLWTANEINASSFINQCKVPVNHIFPETNQHNKIKNKLSTLLQIDNWEMVRELVYRNKEVTAEREGAPWMSVKESLLEVHHSESEVLDPDFNPLINYDNSYFINSYYWLFKQITEAR